jgi:hypothetical protein
VEQKNFVVHSNATIFLSLSCGVLACVFIKLFLEVHCSCIKKYGFYFVSGEKNSLLLEKWNVAMAVFHEQTK